MDEQRRAVPRTDRLLTDARLTEATRRLGPAVVKRAVRAAQDDVRIGRVAPADAADVAVAALPRSASSLRPVINATGVVLHTNLGRAALSVAAARAVHDATGTVDVEFDLATGRRARRGRGALATLRRRLPDAEDVLLVNNGAAALVLATSALAAGRTVVISRGELIEIGDGFRLPDLIESTGVRIREVGTTNRVTVDDYAGALDASTAAIVKIHPSNFRIDGFTSTVPVSALAGLDVPVIADVGSGLLDAEPLLPDEPDVASALRAGASLVTCSGDKLLGGPQAGILAGRADPIRRARRHPLARALRVDKLTIAAMEATLDGPASPTAIALRVDANTLRARCTRIADAVRGDAMPADVVASGGVVGGGSAPGVVLPGWAVAVAERVAARLRTGHPAIVGRIEGGRCLLDLRCVDPADDDVLIAAVLAAHDETAG